MTGMTRISFMFLRTQNVLKHLKHLAEHLLIFFFRVTVDSESYLKTYSSRNTPWMGHQTVTGLYEHIAVLHIESI